MIQLAPVLGELPVGFDAMRAEALAEGHRFLERLATDWASGTMRFDREGEALLAAHSDDALAAIGGTTIDPVVAGVLRMRRFYVRPHARRSHVGRRLALALLERAAGFTRVVTVNAATGSTAFWESLGFLPDRRDSHTHILHLG